MTADQQFHCEFTPSAEGYLNVDHYQINHLSDFYYVPGYNFHNYGLDSMSASDYVTVNGMEYSGNTTGPSDGVVTSHPITWSTVTTANYPGGLVGNDDGGFRICILPKSLWPPLAPPLPAPPPPSPDAPYIASAPIAADLQHCLDATDPYACAQRQALTNEATNEAMRYVVPAIIVFLIPLLVLLRVLYAKVRGEGGVSLASYDAQQSVTLKDGNDQPAIELMVPGGTSKQVDDVGALFSQFISIKMTEVLRPTKTKRYLTCVTGLGSCVKSFASVIESIPTVGSIVQNALTLPLKGLEIILKIVQALNKEAHDQV